MIPFAKSAMSATHGAHGSFRLKTTVLGLGASIRLIAASRYPQPFACARASSIENLTSAEVIGLPFENLTPLRSLNVYVFPSLDLVYEVASHGFRVVPSLPTS